MLFVYNFLQILGLIIAFPFLLIIASRKKYRGNIVMRLGFGLQKLFHDQPVSRGKIIWIHALSVGEVTSALPLVKGLREEMPDAVLVFSSTTSTGKTVAENKIRSFVNYILPGPVDLIFSVNRFIRTIRPDLFILVETDFWPNWLNRLRRSKIPMVLVNGRISQKSFTTYTRFRFFFAPLFRSFSLLSMQTGQDAACMEHLGVPAEKITTLGNLKYDTAPEVEERTPTIQKSDLFIPVENEIWLCGSTHKGEEELLLAAFAKVKKEYEHLVLIIAPRDPDRSDAITDIAFSMGLDCFRRTDRDSPGSSVLILDTIGELTQCYGLAKIAFIGGSLVPCGGHNPLEAAAFGVPVLFGPHMEDFQEIATDFLHYKAGFEVHSTDEIAGTVKKILQLESLHSEMSQSAKQLIQDKSGVVAKHVNELKRLLNRG